MPAKSKPQRIQLRRVKGWRIPENTVKVDRSTPWGNPWVVGKDGSRAECVEKYRRLLGGLATLTQKVGYVEQRGYVIFVREHIKELHGKNLACWCPIGKPCHADVLLEAAMVSAEI